MPVKHKNCTDMKTEMPTTRLQQTTSDKYTEQT